MEVLKGMNPKTGEFTEEIAATQLKDVPLFYENSRQAFPNWSGLSMDTRLHYLNRLQDLLVRDMEKIAKIIARDTGKPLTEALVADIMPTLDATRHIIKHAKSVLRPKKIKTPLLLIGKKSYVEYMARGVVLVISPWNYPLQLALVPVVSALISGNTVILKPSEVTPLVGKCIESYFQKAGFPKDVVQVAHGGKALGAAFTNGQPDYIFFTGSVRTGKIIQEIAAKNLIPTTLELGGNDPFIVFSDAHLKRAAKGAVWAAFTNSGQVCMSAERVFVERSIYDQFLQLVKDETKALVQGMNDEVDIGSMTFPMQKEIVRKQVENALQNGAQLIAGKHPDEWDHSMFIEPMILTNVDPSMSLVSEETFGPVLPIMTFDTEEEVIEKANQSEYGLNASVWTSDISKGRRVASRLVSGAVVINDVIVSIANHHLPFGGTKHSGIGRYHGEQGLRTFCHEKAIVVDRGKKKNEIQWYPYNGKYKLFLELFSSYFSNRKNWIRFLKNYVKLLRK